MYMIKNFLKSSSKHKLCLAVIKEKSLFLKQRTSGNGICKIQAKKISLWSDMWSKRVLRQSGSENKKTKKCRKPSKINGFQHFLFGRSVEVLPYGKIPSFALCEQALTASLGMRTPSCYARM